MTEEGKNRKRDQLVYNDGQLNDINMINIKLPGHRQPVPIRSIMWLEGEASYTRLHYQDGVCTLVSQPLRWFEEQLRFVRVHKSAIVNPVHVRQFDQKKGRAGWVKLTDGTVLPVSRGRLEYTAHLLEQNVGTQL